MCSTIAWGFCNMAFAASRDTCFPDAMRHVFQKFGVFWYWVALALEGRALEILGDLRAENARADAATLWLRAKTGLRQPWLTCFGFARSAADVVRAQLLSLKRSGPAGWHPRIPAWSLPNVRGIRGLGLGRAWVVACPFCHLFHVLTPGEGTRTAHCRNQPGSHAYHLSYAGDLPPGLRERFRLSISGDWPRLLVRWAHADAAELGLELFGHEAAAVDSHLRLCRS